MRIRLDILRKYLGVFAYLRVLRRHSLILTVLILSKVASLAINMTMPLLTRFLIDDVVGRANWEGFAQATLFLGALLVAALGSALMVSYLSTRLEQMVDFDLRRKVQKKWETLPTSYFKRWGVGEHIYRSTTDIRNVTNALVGIIPQFGLAHLQFFLFLIIAATLNLRLTCWFIVALPFVIAVEILRARATRPVQCKVQAFSAQVNNSVGQYVTGAAIIKVFSLERASSRRYVTQLTELVRLALSRWRIETRFYSLGWLFNTVWGWGVILYGFALVMKGELTLGTLIALKMYLSSIAESVQDFSTLIQTAVLGSVSAERLGQTLNDPSEPAVGINQQEVSWVENEKSELRFESVTFGYESNCPVLESVNVAFPERGLIGITGPSGSGKTTLVALIARLYEPWAGCILFNEVDIRKECVREVRALVSIVTQDTFLFSCTIEENIAYGDSGASHDRVVQAAKMAEADEFIQALPDGYQTEISESNSGLSLGQKQRIGMARAFLKNCPILVVDEGMNSIDEPTRQRIMNNLIRLATQKAVLYITHDIRTLDLCDAVFVVMNRKIEALDAKLLDQRNSFVEYLRMKMQSDVQLRLKEGTWTTASSSCKV